MCTDGCGVERRGGEGVCVCARVWESCWEPALQTPLSLLRAGELSVLPLRERARIAL